jgi:arsenate reductase
MPTVVYTYANCDTCRRATKWLRNRKLDFVEKPIRDIPPTPLELCKMLEFQGGELRKLFNTAGRDYRELNLKDKLPTMQEKEAFGLLAGNGNLVKRPFLLSGKAGLVGFDEAEWAAALK